MALSPAAQQVVDDHNALNDTDEVSSAKEIMHVNLSASQRWEVFDYLINLASETDLMNLADYLKTTSTTTMIVKKSGGKIIHPDPTRPSGQA